MGKKPYRPEGFKNPFEASYVVKIKGHNICYHSLFEAGADEMLKALTSQTHQDWLATLEGESCRGKWVFIPR